MQGLSQQWLISAMQNEREFPASQGRLPGTESLGSCCGALPSKFSFDSNFTIKNNLKKIHPNLLRRTFISETSPSRHQIQYKLFSTTQGLN